MTTSNFYDRYHLQNQGFSKVIGKNNFTYFYTLPTLHSAYIEATKNASLEKKQIRVLDVGCGVGTLSLYLGTLGAQVHGVDISPRAINLATAARDKLALSNVTFAVGQVTKGRGNFDLVICSEVIEHVPNQDAFLQLLQSNLKPGGVLYLSTPSTENVLYRLGFYQEFDQRVGHLRRYTPKSLTAHLRRAGFSILELHEVEGPLRNLLFTTPLGFLIRGIRGPLVPFFHFFDRISQWLGGATDIQVIAKR